MLVLTLLVPEREASIWRFHHFKNDIRTNSLAGEPRPELDLAWHNLLQSNA